VADRDEIKARLKKFDSHTRAIFKLVIEYDLFYYGLMKQKKEKLRAGACL
jgi:hypothetical protein